MFSNIINLIWGVSNEFNFDKLEIFSNYFLFDVLDSSRLRFNKIKRIKIFEVIQLNYKGEKTKKYG